MIEEWDVEEPRDGQARRTVGRVHERECERKRGCEREGGREERQRRREQTEYSHVERGGHPTTQVPKWILLPTRGNRQASLVHRHQNAGADLGCDLQWRIKSSEHSGCSSLVCLATGCTADGIDLCCRSVQYDLHLTGLDHSRSRQTAC